MSASVNVASQSHPRVIAATLWALGGLTLWWAGARLSAALSIGVLPLILFAMAKRWRGSQLIEPDIGTIILLAYALFFPLRVTTLAITDYESVAFLGFGRYQPETVTEIGMGMGVAMSAFVAGYLWPPGYRWAARWPELLLRPNGVLGLPTVVIALTFGSALGFGLVLVSNGGIAAVAEKFSRHSKDVSLRGTEQLGLTLWLTLSPFAAWLSVANLAASRHRALARLLAATIILPMLGIALFQFGSRSQAVMLLIGCGVIYHFTVTPLRWRFVVPAALAVAAASVGIVLWRTGAELDILTAEPVWELVAANLSHWVLDTMVAVHESPRPFAEWALDVNRWLQLGVATVPRFIWPSKPLLSETRLDVAAAQLYSGVTWSDTGFPASIAGEWLAIGGWTAVIVATYTFGVGCAWTHRWLVRSNRDPIAITLYAAITLAAFKFFKDGDVVMSAITLYKSLAYFAVLAFMTGIARVVLPKRTADVHPRGSQSARA